MSRTPPTLPTDPLPDPGVDYVALRTEGIRLVQRMAGDIWTDYNFSDPGVTSLEQLCFALTELSYRALYPVADLLADPRTGRVHPWRQALYPARAIMPTNPVTVADLRRLLLDRVPGLGNVWLIPLAPGNAGTDRGVAWLYDIRIHVARHDGGCDCDGGADEVRAGRVVRRVLDRYGAHRALCEDVASATVLRPVPTWVGARVLIEKDADSAMVQAELMFALGLRLAPEPKRISLEHRLAAGQSTAEIFDGPLMLRGFIADSELQPLPTTVDVSDLLQVMAALPGVLLVEELTVRLADSPADSPQEYGTGDIIAIPRDGLPALITRAVDGRYPIRLYQGLTQCRPDPDRVRRLLNRMWRTHRRTHDLWAAYREHYRAPEGRRLDLAAYSSVQDQFPDVYGINAYGLPSNAPTARRAQARQFKGYLMPFDQLMADFLSQLAFVRDLFSPRAGGDRTYVWRSLAGIVPDAAPLLRPDYAPGLAGIVAAGDPVRRRQSDILELLLSLYAGRLVPPSGGNDDSTGDGTGDGTGPSAALVRAKRELLVRMVRATRDRGRGFDDRRPLRFGGAAGMEIRCRIELDLIDAATAASRDDESDRDGGGAILVEDSANATLGQPLPSGMQDMADCHFMPAERMLEDLPMPDGPAGSPLAGHRVAAALLPALCDATRYRIGFQPDQDTVTVICRGTDGRWWVIDEHPDPVAALTAIHHLVCAAGRMRRRQLTIVEHTLLRYAMALTGGDGDGYGLRISAVLAATRDEASDAGWRRQVETVLRRNTPAHIAVTCLFLDRERMRHFQSLHAAWIDALRRAEPVRRAETSVDLERFLDSCRPGTAP